MSNTFLNPVLIEIRVSKMLAGQIGLFAACDIKKGTVIADASKLGERFIPWSDLKKLNPVAQRKIFHYCIATEEGFYAPQDFNYLSAPWNMNHSCSYNVGFDSVGNFATAHDVRESDELTWDFGMGWSDPAFRLECVCGGSNCRKIITGSDWKNKEYVERNRKYFLRELLAKADEFHSPPLSPAKTVLQVQSSTQTNS